MRLFVSSSSYRSGRCFNPHPSCLLGATATSRFPRCRPESFQSSPKLSPGCDPNRPRTRTNNQTFQSSPKLSPGCDNHVIRAINDAHGVSILTQVVSWVRHVSQRQRVGIVAGFNPHPSCLLGATVWLHSLARSFGGFQSSPKLSPGCDGQRERVGHRFVGFQSSPKLSPGCDPVFRPDHGSDVCFNPHPSCLLGATQFCLFQVLDKA